MAELPQEVRIIVGSDNTGGGPLGIRADNPQHGIAECHENQDEQQIMHAGNLLGPNIRASVGSVP